jgi:hypothetical protein
MPRYRPRRIPIERVVELWTFRDAVDYIADTLDVDLTGRQGRLARRCVEDAYREFTKLHQWSYYQASGFIETIEPISDGTIAYDHTGGSDERLLTLSDATWPADLRGYRILIDEKSYPIGESLSTTTAVLFESRNPGADIAAGTSYHLFKCEYELPSDFSQQGGLVELQSGWYPWPQYVPIQEGLEWLTADQYPQDSPELYTLHFSDHFLGETVLQLFPPPATVRRYDFSYRRIPASLQQFGTLTEYYEGTVTGSNGEFTLTGAGTAWDSRMLGCVLRLPEATSIERPTGRIGSDESVNPFAFQAIVESVESATGITLDRALEADYTDTPYTVGSYLDLAADAMLNCFWRLSEYHYAMGATRLKKVVDERYDKFRMALSLAKEADVRQGPVPGGSGVSRSIFDLARRNT